MKNFLFLILFACSLFTAGCASHYSLGTTLDENLRDVYVPSVRNESDQPDAARHLTSALFKEIRRDGTLHIVPEAEAKTRLEVTVTKYDQESASYTQHDTQTPNRYRMFLTARVRFVQLPRPQAGIPEEKVIWQKENLVGDETFDGGSDSLSFKLQCLPDVAGNLAEAIVDGCISAW